jgi:protein-disulfide isomerase
MKRALLVLTLLAGLTAEAQSLDPAAPIKAYTARVLPQCLGGVLSLEQVNGNGPKNFRVYGATLRSDDQYCGTQKYVLYSPTSGQILVGSVIPLPADGRTAADRISSTATEMLKSRMKATISPFPLPDGIHSVNIIRDTPFGPFNYQAFVDASESFLIVGFRGNLNTSPAKTMVDMLGAANGVSRGVPTSKVQILELSDFQCPTCAKAHELVEPIIEKNLGKISYTRLDLPLFEHHEWALPAAMAARAIQRVAPKKYWDYVNYVFKNQEAIGKRKFDDFLGEYLDDHDIDRAAVQKIYASATERAALLDQVSRAFAVGVNSTPTYIINGQIMGFGPEGSFTVEAIKNAVGAPKTAAAAPAKKKK